MGVLGLGVGGFSAAMPGVILAATPKSETSSAMSFNYVVRSVGYSMGSAVGGLVLAAGTDAGRLFPNDDAYTMAALVGIAAMTATTLTCLALARRRSTQDTPTVAPAGEPQHGRARKGADPGPGAVAGPCRAAVGARMAADAVGGLHYGRRRSRRESSSRVVVLSGLFYASLLPLRSGQPLTTPPRGRGSSRAMKRASPVSCQGSRHTSVQVEAKLNGPHTLGLYRSAARSAISSRLRGAKPAPSVAYSAPRATSAPEPTAA